MNCISLFDGISVGRLAIERAKLPLTNYYTSEIDQYALEVARMNFPSNIELGDIKELTSEKLSELDDISLLLCGSPCQNLSSLGDGTGLNGSKSSLFYEALRVLNEIKPKYWLFENVASMRTKDRDKISELLGVEPILINSALVSGQVRKRYYWSNIPGVTQPEDKGILLQDILIDGYADRKKAHALLTNQLPETEGGLTRYLKKSTGQIAFREKYFTELDKSTKIKRYGNLIELGRAPEPNSLYRNGVFRHLSVNECEALQTLPKDYTAGISKSQRFKCLGNSFTTEVITYILKHIPNEKTT